jgi:YHS domain-containing protein
MTDLTDIDRKIQERLAAAEERRRQCQERVEQHQLELEQRFQRFGQTADRILQTLIRPRLQKLAEHFDNAELLPADQSGRYRCVCRFRHTQRFPATAKLTLSVSHDSQVEKLIAGYDLEILPVFFQFERHDEIVFPLDGVAEPRLAEWLDAKLLQFVDTFLQLEMADQYQKENLVTDPVDPVCGSRITKLCAVAQQEHQGRTVYFCSHVCHSKFTAEPHLYTHSGKS